MLWLKHLSDWQAETQDPGEFLDALRFEIGAKEVYVFTPKGRVIGLPSGGTPVDFAYAVHTEVGNTTVGAKVNGKMVPLKYRLKSGDTVEILTSKTQTPSKDWLKICKTSRAITKIRQHLMKVERDDHRKLGESILEKALKKFDTSIKALEKKQEFKIILDKHHYKSLEELFVNIGSNHLPIKDVLIAIPSISFTETDELDFKEEDKELESYFKQTQKTARKSTNSDNAVIVDGLDDIMVKMGRCCNPIPGDPIKGIITRGRGITVHTVQCGRIQDMEKSRQIYVEWNKHYTFSHPVNIKVTTHDKPGILSKISKSINNSGINIRSAIARSMPDQKGNFIFEIEVKDYSELLRTISSIEQMEEVISVNRA
jgi:GTP pyrophosphokinase